MNLSLLFEVSAHLLGSSSRVQTLFLREPRQFLLRKIFPLAPFFAWNFRPPALFAYCAGFKILSARNYPSSYFNKKPSPPAPFWVSAPPTPPPPPRRSGLIYTWRLLFKNPSSSHVTSSARACARRLFSIVFLGTSRTGGFPSFILFRLGQGSVPFSSVRCLPIAGHHSQKLKIGRFLSFFSSWSFFFLNDNASGFDFHGSRSAPGFSRRMPNESELLPPFTRRPLPSMSPPSSFVIAV